jgi:hypothetical protein
MNIGGYELYSIETSGFSLDGGAMFGIIPKPMWEKEAPPDDKNRIAMVTRSLLLVGHNKKIIIDTGNGDKWQDKLKSIYSKVKEVVTKAFNAIKDWHLNSKYIAEIPIFNDNE